MLLPRLLATVLVPVFLSAQITDRVVCAANPSQTYALYLPLNYSASSKWPIVFCFDPGARGRIPVDRFQKAAQAHGFIIAASNNSHNGDWQNSIDAFAAMSADANSRYAIDPRRVYLAGFSGGARVASQFAQTQPSVAGVIASGAGFPGRIPPHPAFAWFGGAGVDDFNYPEVKSVAQTLTAAGSPARFVAFPGGHDWPPPDVCDFALDWMDLRAMKTGALAKSAPRIAELLKKSVARAEMLEPGARAFEFVSLANDFRGLAETGFLDSRAAELQGSRDTKAFQKRERDETARQERGEREFTRISSDLNDASLALQAIAQARSVASDLRRQATSPSDSSDRRVARRILAGQSLRFWDLGHSLLDKKDYSHALLFLEVAASIRPWAPSSYELARAYALTGHTRESIAALKTAVSLGFDDAAALEQESAFVRLRGDEQFHNLLAQIKHAAP